MTKIILNGCLGKMGQAVRALADSGPECEIVAGIDIASSKGGLTFPTYQEIMYCDMPADVVIDFSSVDAIPALLQFGVARQIPLVICTTGLSQALLADIRAASEKVAVFQSANMSLGINLISNMVGKASQLLSDAGFDIEIVEKHHNQKLDAPSGTALLLADAVNRALDGTMSYVYDRTGALQKRSKTEIGIHSLRGGTIVGEHSVVFAGKDEVIEFTHIAQSKEVFAVGAVKAARFIKGKGPGYYDMQDLINAM